MRLPSKRRHGHRSNRSPCVLPVHKHAWGEMLMGRKGFEPLTPLLAHLTPSHSPALSQPKHSEAMLNLRSTAHPRLLSLLNMYQVMIGIVVGLGTILYIEGLRRNKAAEVSALELSTPFFATVLGFLVLRDLVTQIQIAGMFLDRSILPVEKATTCPISLLLNMAFLNLRSVWVCWCAHTLDLPRLAAGLGAFMQGLPRARVPKAS